MVAILVLLTIVTFILADWIGEMLRVRRESKGASKPREAPTPEMAAMDLRSEVN